MQADAPRTIDVLAFPDVQLLDVAGPLQVFASANELAAAAGLPPPYRPRVVSRERHGQRVGGTGTRRRRRCPTRTKRATR